MLRLPRVPIGHEQENGEFSKLALIEKAVTWPAERERNGNHCQPALSIGLEVFWSCELFVLKRFSY